MTLRPGTVVEWMGGRRYAGERIVVLLLRRLPDRPDTDRDFGHRSRFDGLVLSSNRPNVVVGRTIATAIRDNYEAPDPTTGQFWRVVGE